VTEPVRESGDLDAPSRRRLKTSDPLLDELELGSRVADALAQENSAWAPFATRYSWLKTEGDSYRCIEYWAVDSSDTKKRSWVLAGDDIYPTVDDLWERVLKEAGYEKLQSYANRLHRPPHMSPEDLIGETYYSLKKGWRSRPRLIFHPRAFFNGSMQKIAKWSWRPEDHAIPDPFDEGGNEDAAHARPVPGRGRRVELLTTRREPGPVPAPENPDDRPLIGPHRSAHLDDGLVEDDIGSAVVARMDARAKGFRRWAPEVNKRLPWLCPLCARFQAVDPDKPSPCSKGMGSVAVAATLNLRSLLWDDRVFNALNSALDPCLGLAADAPGANRRKKRQRAKPHMLALVIEIAAALKIRWLQEIARLCLLQALPAVLKKEVNDDHAAPRVEAVVSYTEQLAAKALEDDVGSDEFNKSRKDVVAGFEELVKWADDRLGSGPHADLVPRIAAVRDMLRAAWL
jgi:hypothetical protein